MRARLVLRSVLCAALAGGASLGVVDAAHATPPAAPPSLKATGSNPPELSWAPVPGAVKYEVEADTEPGFSSPPVHTTTVDTSYVPLTLLSAGDYYWQVRAIDADYVDSDWSAGDDFTISPVDPPTGLSPDDGDDPDPQPLAQPDKPPTLSWTPVTGAKSYTVQVAHDTSFAGAKTYTTESPEFVVSDPLAPQSYVWHVKALLDTGIESGYSADASFSVGSIRTPDGLRVIGDDGNTIADDQDVQDVILDWSPVPGAKTYDLQVSKDDSFSTSSIVDNRTGLLATRYSPTTTYDNSQYFWRVRAIDLSGNPTVWSGAASASTFRRQWTEQPQVLFPEPSDGPATVGDPLYLQWTPVHHASHYEVQMGSDSSFSPKTFVTCEVAGTTYTPGEFRINTSTAQVPPLRDEACTPAPGALTYWRVRPLDHPFTSANGDGVLGLWSETQSLTYDPDAERLTNVSPADGATVDIPTLSWSPVRGAETYAITVKKGSTTVATATTHSTSYVVQPSSPLTAGEYTWSITAKNPANIAISMTESRTFTLSGTIPDGTDAPLTARSGRDTDAPTSHAPLLSWAPVPRTGTEKITYLLDARPHGAAGWISPSTTPTGNLIEKQLVYPAVTDPSILFASPGLYDWRVTAYVDGVQVGDPSAVNTFRVTALAVPAESQRIAISGTDLDAGNTCAAPVTDDLPDCATVPTTPVIDWAPVPGASFYIVYIAKDANFTNLVENLSAMPATSNTRWAPTFAQLKSALADSEVGESYFVHVRACASTTSCGMDPTSAAGGATMQFRKQSAPVTLQRPADATTVTTPRVTFDWRDYRDTNAGSTWTTAGGSDAPDQSAMQYRIEVDDDPNFGSPLETAKVDQSTYTSPSELYPDGKLYWRVQAIDVESNDLSWSDKRSFTKQTAAPDLAQPAAGATTGENPTLRWSAQPYAAGYTVELYRNGDTAFSKDNRVFAPTVKQTAYVYNKPLPPSGSPYVWRVAAVDASGNTGRFGQPSTFTVSGANPTLVAPAAGATVPADRLVLRWSPVVGAVSYQVQVQQAAGSTSIDTATTRATAYAPSPLRLIADGGISWRVVAKDSDSQELGTSAWRNLVVKAAPTALRPTAWPRITGTRTVGSTLAVSPGSWPASKPRFTYLWVRNGKPISGATSSYYRLTFADATAYLTVKVTASKTGWGDGTASSNTVRIAKAASRVSAYATPTTIKQGRSTSVVTTVSVPSSSTTRPTGKIRIVDRLGTGRQRTLKTVSLFASAKGRKTISVRLIGVGRHHLRATYLGSAKIAASSSPVVTVRTTR